MLSKERMYKRKRLLEKSFKNRTSEETVAQHPIVLSDKSAQGIAYRSGHACLIGTFQRLPSTFNLLPWDDWLALAKFQTFWGLHLVFKKKKQFSDFEWLKIQRQANREFKRDFGGGQCTRHVYTYVQRKMFHAQLCTVAKQNESNLYSTPAQPRRKCKTQTSGKVSDQRRNGKTNASAQCPSRTCNAPTLPTQLHYGTTNTTES